MRTRNYSQDDISALKDLIRFKKIRKGLLNKSQRAIIKDRFRNDTFKLHFSKSGTEYVTCNGKIIIPKEKIFQCLKQLYYSPSVGREGKVSFFNNVKSKFEGITLQDVSEFLDSMPTKQKFEKRRPKLYHSIVSKYPKHRFEMDFIDLQKFSFFNLGYSYCLMVIDTFSRYLWVFPTKSRDSSEIERSLRKLFDSGFVPKILQSDNEFKSTTVRNLAQEYEFKALFSSPYSPNSQSHVERVNRTIKNMMYSYFDKHNTKFWMDVIKEITKNYNHSVHQSTGMKPFDLFLAGPETIDKVNERLESKRKKKAEKLGLKDIQPYSVGDHVRIDLLAFQESRKLEMSGIRRGYKPKFTSQMYQITKVLLPRKTGRIIEYMVKNLKTQRSLRKRIKHNHVLKISSETDERVPKKRKFSNLFDREEHLKRIRR